jgi:hypothetical protein
MQSKSIRQTQFQSQTPQSSYSRPLRQSVITPNPIPFPSTHHPRFQSPFPSIISQQWRPLTILADDLTPREWIATQKSWKTNRRSNHEKQAANREGKDPLELEEVGFGQELAYTGRYRSH